MPADITCSFCIRPQREAKKMIAGPSVHICDECVSLCVDILAQDSPDAPTVERELSRLRREKIKALEINGRLVNAISAIEREIAACRKDSEAMLASEQSGARSVSKGEA